MQILVVSKMTRWMWSHLKLNLHPNGTLESENVSARLMRSFIESGSSSFLTSRAKRLGAPNSNFTSKLFCTVKGISISTIPCLSSAASMMRSLSLSNSSDEKSLFHSFPTFLDLLVFLVFLFFVLFFFLTTFVACFFESCFESFCLESFCFESFCFESCFESSCFESSCFESSCFESCLESCLESCFESSCFESSCLVSCLASCLVACLVSCLVPCLESSCLVPCLVTFESSTLEVLHVVPSCSFLWVLAGPCTEPT